MKKIIAVCSLAALAAACGAKQETAAKTPAPAAPQPAAASTAAPTPAPVPEAVKTQPAAARATQPQPQNQIAGTVAETMDAAGYTYVNVKTADGAHWAAVPQTSLKKGAPVAINAQMVLDNFESKTLNRKFDKIIFGTVAGAQPAAPPSGMASAAMPVAQRMQAPASGDVKVAKAEGGKTVAEIWAAKENGKDVVVRGKVVKFLGGIMGKNWLHLRDGSGSKSNGDDDITVTTDDVAAVGDVVVVRGKLAVDKDFGAGYRYPVIIEQAKLSK